MLSSKASIAAILCGFYGFAGYAKLDNCDLHYTLIQGEGDIPISAALEAFASHC
jgi:hypothetical protein